MCCCWCICILVAGKRLQHCLYQAVCKHCWTCPEDPTTSKNSALLKRKQMHTPHFSFSNLRVQDAKCNNISWHFHKNTWWREISRGGKKSTSKPCTKYCDFSHTPAMLLTFPSVKPSWHLQPTQNSLDWFFPAMAFLPFSQHMLKINIWCCQEAPTFQC